MQTYLVGGAVRDRLLGLAVTERDWVVVGATADELRKLGYRQVGNSFPVFLHPQSSEEYALARTERKTAPGYQGFAVDFSEHITLEQDLARRDLTINAIAETTDGTLIDPFNGRADIERRVLRHVSAAFIEDPLRVLRVARFLARFAELGFAIADNTLQLMREIVDAGEISHLTPERVWQELHKALQTSQPWQFFTALARCGALPVVLPGSEKLLERCNLALQYVSHHSDDACIRFATWVACLPADTVEQLCGHLRLPKDFAELAQLTRQQYSFFERSTQLPPPEILQGLKAVDAFRRPQRFENYLLAADAIANSNPEQPGWPQPQREYLHTAWLQASAITAKDLTKLRLQGKELADELDLHRRAAISKVKRTYRWAKFR